MTISIMTLCLIRAALLLSTMISAQCPSRCQHCRSRTARDCRRLFNCSVQRCNVGQNMFACARESNSSSIRRPCPNKYVGRSEAWRACNGNRNCLFRSSFARRDGFECVSANTSPSRQGVSAVVAQAKHGTAVVPTVPPAVVPPSQSLNLVVTPIPTSATSTTPAGCISTSCDFLSKPNDADPCAPCVSRIRCDGRQRVRKEYHDLTAAQREAFVNAVTELNRDGVWGEVARVYGDDFDSIHGGGNFFPWHAGLLFFIESWMMDLQPRLPGLPYFAWGAEKNIRASSMWDSENVGGSSTGEGPIPNGPFQGFLVDGVSVTRQFSATNFETADEVAIAAVIANVTYLPFWGPAADEVHTLSPELKLMHDFFHVVVSGTMASVSSPRDPVFYLHHAYVDKWWSQDWPTARGFMAEDHPAKMLGILPLERCYANLEGMSNNDSIENQRCVEYQNHGFIPQRAATPEPLVTTSDLVALAAVGGNTLAKVQETGATIVEAVVAAVNTTVIPQINEAVIDAVTEIAEQFNAAVSAELQVVRQSTVW